VTLERFGYEVILAEDGRQGVEAFRRSADRVGVVLLDMTMPVMSGEEAFRELRMIRPDIKVILSSGYNEVEAIRHFTGKGLAGFIQKPYTSMRLAEAVRSVLNPAARRDEPQNGKSPT
jgi:DNA-binding NtrC family response regulator